MAKGPIEVTVKITGVEPMKSILQDCVNVLEWWKDIREQTEGDFYNSLTKEDDVVFDKLRDSIKRAKDA